MSSETPQELNQAGFAAEEPFEFPQERVILARLSDEPLSPAEAEAEVWAERAGAVVGFSGIVRNHDQGQPVHRLSYTAHPSAAEAIAQVAVDVAARFPTVRVWVAHRVGELGIGDHALVAAVASAHRAEAFQACAELVEATKQQVPIWKEQFFADGSKEWVGL
ncbi:molybdenum cofactor biosynthesis protein MoaE [Nesterenkonia sp. AN1]|uniref:Molybdopterin synthase subunit MoaE n=1 Tax=Nesterenkonia aurantiaca TaxID=1436010 RepID=A0A4R7G2U0_9MICC|nr:MULTISPECIES: molybdenum cofactor biosynthesis protein MoaE [Nesterenkonia]EXF25738.1 molybdenum cofactor biosynthesis protein MoaE [Nesterenkonia sp. AN1]TDS85673.1 molybdopterin synthase subunit MoaE [Nesterenkonia aurantiaca]